MHPKHKHAAIVFYNGEIIAWGNNTKRHAEVNAIVIASINGYRRNLILISVAITRFGKLKLAKPCEPCEKYCKRHGVRTIYYSTNHQSIIKMEDY